MIKSKRFYGCIKDKEDQRDFMFAARPERRKALPPLVDLRPVSPTPYDQGQLGSCTGNGIARTYQMVLVKQLMAKGYSAATALAAAMMPSRLFIYHGERVMEGTVNQDSGGQIRDGMKFVAASGVCPEVGGSSPSVCWPYNISKFTVRPPNACFAEALNHEFLTYLRVNQTLAEIQGCLALGFPVIIGFTVFSSFESATVAKTGIMPMPKAGEQNLGGHCVVVVGYDNSVKRFIVCNSWGTGWGMKGYFTMPYDFLINPSYASDFWTVRLEK